VDGKAGVGMAVDHLADRGHTRIAWIGWQKNSYIGEDRRSGWVDRMHDRGLATSRLSARGEDTIDFGRRAACALLESEAPTGFVCASDTLAMGVLQALRDRGLRAGGDPQHEIAVVGFDDSLPAQVTDLTSLRQPLEQVAVEIVRLLDERLTHPMDTQPGVLLPPALCLRASS
jgi:LacI family transcriptional regulator